MIAYFDPSKATELVTDASPLGLSAILMQNIPGTKDRRVVAYASRALTDVEKRYSQTVRSTNSSLGNREAPPIFIWKPF